MYSEARKPVTQKRNLLTAIPGPKSAELLKRRGEAVSASLGTAFPVFIDHSEGAIIVDVDGNSILDLGAGIAVLNVGHSAKEVRENVKRQIDAFTHTCFMVVPYTGYVEVCEALNRLTPGTHKKKSALFNSGAEAIENAVKIARRFTKRSAVVVFEHGYHGRTNLTMAMTAKSMPYKDGFGPFAPEVYRMPLAYAYRCDACTKPCESSVLSMVLHKIEKEIGASNVACIVIEPILGEGGFIVPCKGFLPGLAKFCKENGIVFIADEVQTGFARTGDMFACEDESVIPDLIVTAKGIAAGMPLAGVTGRAEIMDSIHLSGLGGTYGGNPVACAAALGAIEIIERDNLAQRANKIGKILTDALNAMAKKYPIIGEVRGRGAMQAIELIKPGTLDPNPEALTAILKYCTSKGVLILSAGTYANVIRLLPPLIIEEDLLRDGLAVLDEAIASLKA
ncbi:MAG: 4-aminobutyrate--2-oxoglutarate transaminase [Candidatus Nanopelagicus sp.]|jgi:4-aminobutyrate aminotransferase/(S)-3-amino-2-methylpropionate transaminase|nr:4-aminobutyrate--2-oxoglutarate transaminase [Candidatus Nanopelagicus sp.]